jgi:siroheme synthase-like protein
MEYPPFYPVFLNLVGRKCLVVGGGNVAAEKVGGLLLARADVTVVSPLVGPEIGGWALEGRLKWIAREFEDGDLEGMFLTIAGTDDEELNRRAFHLADRTDRLANSVDDPDFCNYITPAITRAGPIQVAVSSSGASPALAQRIRRQISEQILDESTGDLATFLGSWRDAVKSKLSGYLEKKAFWESVLSSPVPDLLADGKRQLAMLAMAKLLDHAALAQGAQ